MIKLDFYIYSFKSLRALIFKALFVIYANNFIYGSNILLNNIDNNCIWLKYSSIEDSVFADNMIDFLIDNQVNKVFFETYTDGEILYKENKRIFESLNGYFQDINISGNDTTSLRGYNPNQEDTTFSIISNPVSYFFTKIDSIDDIKIYAWLDMYKLWDKNFYPDDKNHFYYKCPECLESDMNGRSDKLIKLDKIQSLEWEGIFLSPLHPNVNIYLMNIVSEVLKKYNFDGLLLDYVRYQNYYYGYNDIGLQLFEDTYNFSPLDLDRGIISKYFNYSDVEIDSMQTLWDNYRIDKVTDLVLNIKQNIDSLNYELLVSVNSTPEESENRWYQNWSNWIDNGLVDYVIVQNYNTDFYDFNYKNKMLSKKSNLEKVIIGLNIYGDNNIDLANKILALRLQNFNNISLYYYEDYKSQINWYKPIYDVLNFNINYE
tara:strand:- start:48829 stop:50121 length:1293 start_codon:yes stop_codon:yes gene_type:complete